MKRYNTKFYKDFFEKYADTFAGSFEKKFIFHNVEQFRPAGDCRVLVMFGNGAVRETYYEEHCGFHLLPDMFFDIKFFAYLPQDIPQRGPVYVEVKNK